MCMVYNTRECIPAESREHKLIVKLMAKPRLLLQMFTLCFLMMFNPCICCLQYQKEALLEFKFLLLGNNSSNSTNYLNGLESWNSSSSSCCAWKLVSCSRWRHLLQVIGLDLKHVTFSPLKSALVTSDVLTPLFHLRTLTFLDISVNNIHGEIPGIGLANLTQLVELRMDRNSFNGSIPVQLFSLKNLEYLRLSDNLIGGTLGSNFGNLSNLIELYLDYNKFSGSIPSSLLHLKELEELDLGYNLLSMRIPAEIGNLSNIRGIYLDGNYLSGEIPESIQEMKNLKTLHLGNNSLSGEIRPFLFRFPVLSSVVLSKNHFSGLLPNISSGEANGMMELDLSRNNLWGPIPKSITTVSSLYLLDLSRNKFSLVEYPLFDPNSTLTYADLSFNKISGNVPASFPLGLKVLILSHNEFSGFLPRSLTNLNQLEYLDLRDNNLTGSIPVFNSQSNLQVLVLRNNCLEGSIPFELSELGALRVLDLSDNNLSGKVPPSLGNLTGMSSSNSSSMIFSYDRANEEHEYSWRNYWEEFTEIHDLEVYWKKSWQVLVHLNRLMYFLDLSSNQLSGEIPDSLGNLKYLKSLSMSNNRFSGKVPSSFGDLQSLESLDLSHNNLSGEIPQTLGNLLQLTYLNLKDNRLQGRIPNGPQMNTMNDPDSYANNSGLCGMQIQVPCKKVRPPEPNPPEMDQTMFAKAWFSWKLALIGYLFGLLSTILAMYFIGYFNVAAQPGRKHRFFC